MRQRACEGQEGSGGGDESFARCSEVGPDDLDELAALQLAPSTGKRTPVMAPGFVDTRKAMPLLTSRLERGRQHGPRTGAFRCEGCPRPTKAR